MNSTSFRNFVPSIFAPDETKLERARQRIAREEARIEAERGIATRYAALQDQLAGAQASFSAQCAVLDNFTKPLPDSVYLDDFLRGQKLIVIANDLCARAALKSKVADFKTELRKRLVAPAEKSLADFTKNNKAVIAKLPKLERAAEPEFVPAAPAVEFNDWPSPQPPSAGVRLMLNLRPGETITPKVTAPFDAPTNGQMINNLDDD